MTWPVISYKIAKKIFSQIEQLKNKQKKNVLITKLIQNSNHVPLKCTISYD